jgi:hypothetical protein
MHGGKGSGAPAGNRNARKHGGYSAKTKEASWIKTAPLPIPPSFVRAAITRMGKAMSDSGRHELQFAGL